MIGLPHSHEIALSAAWHAGNLPAELATTDGQVIEIVHRGAWSHGLGPDFRDALLLFDTRELRAGGVEMHLRTRGWIEHGHHLDSAYDTVILHVVARHDGSETRRSNGALVPTLELGDIAPGALPEMASWDWHLVGGAVCAQHACMADPHAVRLLLQRLGDTRLAARSARIEAWLPTEPPGQILWSELLDGFGYSANRDPMRALARVVPVAALEALLLATPPGDRMDVARGLLLGAAGFLPLSPGEAHLGHLEPPALAALEAAWRDRGAPWWNDALPAVGWTRARVRPANHPVPRLLAAANLLAAASHRGGLLVTILETLQDDDVASLFQSLTGDTGAGIGHDRALDMIASGVIPFALALAAHIGDVPLADAAARQWDRLPAPAANALTRRAMRQVAGAARLGRIGARGAQGLIHLDTVLCQPRRCFECPIAAAALAVNGEPPPKSR